jgi:hypothetical protein
MEVTCNVILYTCSALNNQCPDRKPTIFTNSFHPLQVYKHAISSFVSKKINVNTFDYQLKDILVSIRVIFSSFIKLVCNSVIMEAEMSYIGPVICVSKPIEKNLDKI